MDFKVAGSEAGITSLQMDIKITSITAEIMEIALEQAREGRIHILDEMAKALNSARDGLADSAPKITTMKIPVDKIRDIIGPGGKIIREICETTGAKIDIDDDGTVKVAAVTGTSGEAAVARIRDIVAEPELGVIYNGKVVKTVDFGAFVNFLGAKDGLVHISELQDGRTEKTTDICKEGDEVKVKVIGFDDRGKVKLSMKRVDQETGADLEAAKPEEGDAA
jgi:polyribonucleotide nucleotidyltransferase